MRSDKTGAARSEAPRLASPKLLAHDRHVAILRTLRTNGSVQVPAMAASLGVSEMTVRRDLVELEREARLVRIHGGAVAVGGVPPVAMDSDEPSFEARLHRQGGAKEAIAAAAADVLAGCRTVALDGGTTSFVLARRLVDLQHVKVFTSNLRIAALLCDQGPEVYIAGGRVKPGERAVTGPSAVAQFERLWFDASIIGVSGMTAEGFYDYAMEELDMKRVLLSRSSTRIVLCDATKFRRMSLVLVGALAEASMVITDAEPPAEIRAALAAAGVELRIAGSSPAPVPA